LENAYLVGLEDLRFLLFLFRLLDRANRDRVIICPSPTDLNSARPPKGDDTTAVRLEKPWCVREESDAVHVRISQNSRHDGYPSRISQGAT